MRMLKIFICTIFLCYNSACQAHQFSTIQNLSANWQIYKEGKFLPFKEAETAKSIHFQIKLELFKSDFVIINSVERFSLFINGKIIYTGRKYVKLNLDSLKSCKGDLFFSVYSDGGVNSEKLSTTIARQIIGNREKVITPRTINGSTNFFIVATITMFFAFGLLYRANPQLIVEFLNLVKIFSLRDKEENLTMIRITSSYNVLLYLFVSFLISLIILLITKDSTNPIEVISNLEFQTFLQGTSGWILFATLVFTFITTKLVVIVLFSSTYKIRGGLYLHFYGFIRFATLISIIVALACIIIFAQHRPPTEFITHLMLIGPFIVIGWLLFTYVKLLNNTAFNFFHLFSYLCVTEIIPLILFFKIV